MKKDEIAVFEKDDVTYKFLKYEFVSGQIEAVKFVDKCRKLTEGMKGKEQISYLMKSDFSDSQWATLCDCVSATTYTAHAK